MWVVYALVSASLLGLYDVFKKKSLQGNAVIPVLLINTVICTQFFLPSIVGSLTGMISPDSSLYIPDGGWREHKLVIIKAFVVLSSWICGYFAIKKLPLTIVGPVNATRPVMTLVGAMLIFGERLNLLQWAGVCMAIFSFWMLSRSGKKEGIDFKSNVWVLLLVAAAVLGACSGLYDKYLMASSGAGLDRLFVQGWYNLYQAVIMGVIMLLVWLPERKRALAQAVPGTGPDYVPFVWKWTIPFISLALTAADLAYLYALTMPGAMISVVSMIRRSSVLVSFVFGAVVFHEKNLRSKALDLVFVLLSLILLLLGTV